jgi:N-acetylglutamate synthase-like GNAT family acetyltransferase
MNKIIRFAEKNDEKSLQEIMWEYGMDVPGDIEDQLIIEEDKQVIAGGRLMQYDETNFYLEVLGVKQGVRGQGNGELLLKEILRNPWAASKSLAIPNSQDLLMITTIARGEVQNFYRRQGFVACNFTQVPEPYREQCVGCPDKAECNPVPMIYYWRVSQ